MITKEEFVKVINKIEELLTFEHKLGDLLGTVVEVDFGIDMLIFLLEKNMNIPVNDIYGSDIGYFIFELDFGRKYKKGMITDENDNDIDFSTAEKLYDYLTSVG